MLLRNWTFRYGSKTSEVALYIFVRFKKEQIDQRIEYDQHKPKNGDALLGTV